MVWDEKHQCHYDETLQRFFCVVERAAVEVSVSLVGGVPYGGRIVAKFIDRHRLGEGSAVRARHIFRALNCFFLAVVPCLVLPAYPQLKRRVHNVVRVMNPHVRASLF